MNSKHVLKYSKHCVMREKGLYQAEIVNYYIDTLEGCLKEQKTQEKKQFKTEILK